MKQLFIIIFLFPIYLVAQDIPKWEKDIISEKQFTYKAIETCDRPLNYGHDTVAYHIGLKILSLPSDTSKVFEVIYEDCTYYWHKIFDRYTNEDKIKIIAELLDYEKDTDLSGKRVVRYGNVKDGISKPQTKSYNIQVEALYIITLLSMGNFATYYCPYPVLVNNKTKVEINNNPKELKKVYKIYRKWLEENKKTGFRNFPPPLYKSNYSWYGVDEKTNNIKVSEFSLPGTTIGRSKD